VLEQINTPEAMQLIRRMGQGPPESYRLSKPAPSWLVGIARSNAGTRREGAVLEETMGTSLYLARRRSRWLHFFGKPLCRALAACAGVTSGDPDEPGRSGLAEPDSSPAAPGPCGE